MGVVVWKGGTTCASSSFASCDRTKQTRLVCTLAPRLRLWKRGPLAPVVVGEGASEQVNLVYGGRVVAMGKVSKALWLILNDESNRLIFRLRHWLRVVSGTRMRTTGPTGGVCSAYRPC